MSDVKRYTPNSIANEVMAENAWHDSLWIREADHAAALAEANKTIEAIAELIGKQLAEIAEMKGEPHADRCAQSKRLTVQLDAALARAEKAEAEVERLRGRNAEWERKASAWMASPEAAQRLDGYRELAQQLNAAEAERDALRAAIERAITHEPHDHWCEAVMHVKSDEHPQHELCDCYKKRLADALRDARGGEHE